MKVKEESGKAGLKLNIQKTKIMASSPIPSWQTDGRQWQTLYPWALKSLQTMTAAMKLKDACSLQEKLWANLNHVLKNRRYFADKGPSSQSYDFSSSHV